MLKENYKKQEKINSVFYDISPAASYRHGTINGNIYSMIKAGLKMFCVSFSWKTPDNG